MLTSGWRPERQGEGYEAITCDRCTSRFYLMVEAQKHSASSLVWIGDRHPSRWSIKGRGRIYDFPRTMPCQTFARKDIPREVREPINRYTYFAWADTLGARSALRLQFISGDRDARKRSRTQSPGRPFQAASSIIGSPRYFARPMTDATSASIVEMGTKTAGASAIPGARSARTASR